MGITFRSGGHPKRVIIGGRTIKDGEAVAVWNRWGVHQQIVGPRRIHLFQSTIRFLNRRKAEPNQYIRVSHRDGRVEHIQGASSLYENPAFHDNVSVHDGIRLRSKEECIVVYKNIASNSIPKLEDVKGRDIITKNFGQTNGDAKIVNGPCLFIPQPEECVHKFSWSSFKNEGIDHHRSKDDFFVLDKSNRVLSIVLVIPTLDGFSFTIKLVIDYQIISVEKVMNAKDLMEKIHSSLSADAQSLGGSVSSDDLRGNLKNEGNCSEQSQKEYKSNQKDLVKRLSRTDAYPQFVSISSKCGLLVDSLSITNVILCKTLQSFIAKEQQAFAKVSLEYAEKIKQKENLLAEREEKIESSHETNDRAEKFHEDAHQARMRQIERKNLEEKKQAEAKIEILKLKQKLKLDFLRSVKEELGVDMTKFMTENKSEDTKNWLDFEASKLAVGDRDQETLNTTIKDLAQEAVKFNATIAESFQDN